MGDRVEFERSWQGAVFRCPPDWLLVFDDSGRVARRCDVFVVPVVGRGEPDGREIEFARRYLGPGEELAHYRVRVPEGRYVGVASVDAIRYRRSPKLGYFRHPYDRVVRLEACGRKGFRLPLPNGCVINHRGFVTP